MKYNKVPSITESLKRVASSEARNMSALPAMRFMSGVVPSRRNTANGNRKPNRDADKKSVGEIDWNNFAVSRGSYKNFDLISKKESYNVIVEPVEPSLLLLDSYPDAAAAYSLRKLRSDYTGPAIKVRRSSDNAELDINFVNNELDTASLLSFVGANDGFVTTWYDQSGSGNNITQLTATSQSRIVIGGVLSVNPENSLPAVNVGGTNIFMETTTAIATKNLFSVGKLNGLINANYITFSASPFSGMYYGGTGAAQIQGIGLFSISNINSLTGEDLNTHLANFYHNGSNYLVSKDSGTSVDLGSYTQMNTNNVLGRNLNAATSFNGLVQEVVIYSTGDDSNNSLIKSNINSHYNIYWDGSQTRLLDDYPSAAAAYSLRALNSSYTGAAIKVRRSSDNAEQDINLLYDGGLDTASLLSFVGAGDGFVTTWYDQSGLGNDAAQANAANQPKIVSSGVIELENGKPAITTSGAKNLNTGIVNLGVSGDIPLSFYSVQNNQSTSDKDCLIGLTDNTIVTDRRRVFMYLKDDSTKISLRLFGGSCVYNLSPPTNQVLFSSNYASGGGAIDSRVNSTDLTVSSFSNSGLNVQANSGFILFSGNAATAPQLTTTDSASQGSLQECIFYLNDKSASTSAIETNINSYYSIY